MEQWRLGEPGAPLRDVNNERRVVAPGRGLSLKLLAEHHRDTPPNGTTTEASDNGPTDPG